MRKSGFRPIRVFSSHSSQPLQPFIAERLAAPIVCDSEIAFMFVWPRGFSISPGRVGLRAVHSHQEGERTRDAEARGQSEA